MEAQVMMAEALAEHQHRPQALPDQAEDGAATLKTRFLASLNHEIRTPLSGILGMADMLLETPLDEEQKEYVGIARLCAENLLTLLNVALELSDLASGTAGLEVADFHVPETVRMEVEAHVRKAGAKGLELTWQLDETLPQVAAGDPVRIRQAMSHLIDNAIKFTSRGTVSVRASAEEKAGGIVMHLAVSDTGIGISPDKMNAAFEAFCQLESGPSRRFPGLGMGLAVVQGLMKLMNGHVVAESEPGRGSRFVLQIPLRRASQTSQPAPAAQPQSGETPRILLVDDNEVARRIVVHILGRAGYRFDCAASGKEAVEKAARERYDLVLMDLQMPVMDGFASTAALRALPGYQSVPVIALTANTTDAYRSLCRDYGMKAFVAKPVQAGELLGSLAQALAR